MVDDIDALQRLIRDAHPEIPELDAHQLAVLKVHLAHLRPLPRPILVQGSFRPDPALLAKLSDPFAHERYWRRHLEVVLLTNEFRLARPERPASDPEVKTPKPEDVAEQAKPPPPPKTKRRGRTAGVDKIGMAITALNRRLKDRESTTIADIAKEVGCTSKNLENSKRFTDAYGELTRGMKRAVRHRGSKEDGTLEAWTDPRDDREED
jgi:hypothetical protein